MAMNKIQDVKLETTATYQPLSDLNVRFWSQDKNTAELRFIITRNQFPLSLSKENVKVIIALESGSSFISSDDFIIDSEVEGVARYIIPTDFMRVASNVTGQIYVTTLDKEEIIVERQFKFTVSNDLLNDYPSEDKLRYIKTFDDLRNEIASRVSKLESDMETMEDYVVQVQDTTQEGITALTNLIKQKQDAYNANHTAKMKELNDKGSEYSTKFDSDKQYIDEKTEAFKESVTGSGLVTTGESANWQKYKITNDDGDYTFINMQKDLEGYRALPPGNYYTAEVPISGMGQASVAGFTKVETREGNSVKHITFRPYNSSQEFLMRFYNEWSDWEIISPDYNKMETITGAQSKANVAENNAKIYTDDKIVAQRGVLFSGSVSGVGNVISLTESLDNYGIIVISGYYPGGSFSEVVVPVALNSSTIAIQQSNISNVDGTSPYIYELNMSVESSTRIVITGDMYHQFSSGEGSGANANKFTITRIEAMK